MFWDRTCNAAACYIAQASPVYFWDRTCMRKKFSDNYRVASSIRFLLVKMSWWPSGAVRGSVNKTIRERTCAPCMTLSSTNGSTHAGVSGCQPAVAYAGALLHPSTQIANACALVLQNLPVKRSGQQTELQLCPVLRWDTTAYQDHDDAAQRLAPSNSSSLDVPQCFTWTALPPITSS